MPKNIVICCDGTNQDITSESTNVLRLFRSLERSERQLTFYDAGVGALSDPTVMTKFGRLMRRNIDAAIGHSVRDNACRAYQFLANHYNSGDRIYLFGFSRGAYTVRALAGMISFLGLLPPELAELARLGWKVYADENDELQTRTRFASGNRFKSSFSRPESVRVHLVGVWDTVSAFGWFWQLRTVPYTANNAMIDHVRHAMAIDEHRSAFQPNRFRPRDPSQHESFRELWFAGSHSDIGGGYGEEEGGLAKIALKWMIDEASQEGCLFDASQVDHFLGRMGKPSVPDFMGSVHNSICGFWHLLEWLPRRQWDHNAEPEALRWFAPNIYRHRSIPDGASLHASVAQKLDSDRSYRPTNIPKHFIVH